MEVNRAVIIYVTDDSKWIVEREFDNDVRFEWHTWNKEADSWACTVWTTFDAATWTKIVAAMADSADTEVIPHG